MKRKITISLSLLLSLSMSVNAKKIKYDLPGAAVDANVICGNPKECTCGPKDGNPNVMPYKFAVKPFSPSVDDNTTVKSAAASILGQSVPWSMQGATDMLDCGYGDNLFKVTENDIEFVGSKDGYSFKYDATKKASINISATVEADIKEILGSMSIEQSLIDSLRAALSAGYKKVTEKKMQIEGKYYELRISKGKLQDLLSNPLLKDCRTLLETQKRAVITDISIVVFDLSRDLTNDRNLFADLEAKLSRKGINVNLEAKIENSIIQNLSSSVKNTYAVLSWAKRKTY